jgi:hypothetical protein
LSYGKAVWKGVRKDVTPRVEQGDKMGTLYLEVKLGYPITGGHKFRDLGLQVRGWVQG